MSSKNSKTTNSDTLTTCDHITKNTIPAFDSIPKQVNTSHKKEYSRPKIVMIDRLVDITLTNTSGMLE